MTQKEQEKTQNKGNNVKNLVKTLISTVDDIEHPLSLAIKSDTPPIIKAIGFMRVSENHNSWVPYTIITQGDKVLSIETGEPNLRRIAEETAKINFVNLFTDAE